MAQHLKPALLAPPLALCAAMLMPRAGAAPAEALADPTRPQPAAGAYAGPAAYLPGAVLQSTLVAGTRAEAIISGTPVQVGARYGAARVVRITEGEVVLRSPEGLQTLRVFPGTERRDADGSRTATSLRQDQVKAK